mmetsp:Transcript_12588/g.21177  ORF Transcript_12588/g.21177 Transcript_12588/m.21177 type:complete len:165 (+) Transcript_12588:259-753(+)
MVGNSQFNGFKKICSMKIRHDETNQHNNHNGDKQQSMGEIDDTEVNKVQNNLSHARKDTGELIHLSLNINSSFNHINNQSHLNSNRLNSSDQKSGSVMLNHNYPPQDHFNSNNPSSPLLPEYRPRKQSSQISIEHIQEVQLSTQSPKVQHLKASKQSSIPSLKK